MAKKYIVYFEVYGKKLKTYIYANSKDDAKAKVLAAITFHKIEAEEIFDSFIIDFFANFKKPKP